MRATWIFSADLAVFFEWFAMISKALLLGFALALSVAASSCSPPENRAPEQVATIAIDPNRYADFLDKLDLAMRANGLSRYGAAPGLRLSELRGRDVLFVGYQLPNSKWPFVVVTDLIKAGQIEMRLDSKALTDELVREEAMSRLEGLLSEFGSTLRPWNPVFPLEKKAN